MRFAFHPAARLEYLEAVRFYRDRGGRKLGKAFTAEIEACIFQICESPEQNRIWAKDIRRKLTHRFPYGVIYSVEKDSILVVAVMHCSRMPDYWADRTGE